MKDIAYHAQDAIVRELESSQGKNCSQLYQSFAQEFPNLHEIAIQVIFQGVSGCLDKNPLSNG
jgi:hypothetical protein